MIKLLFLAPHLPFYYLSFFSGRDLKMYVNIDTRTLKFGMEHPWTQSIRLRKNQSRLLIAELEVKIQVKLNIKFMIKVKAMVKVKVNIPDHFNNIIKMMVIFRPRSNS